MRSLFVLSFLAATTYTFASYELALIVDNNPAGARVERFDPQTGAYFGSFGLGGVASSAAIAADVNSGTALVQGPGTSMRLYDYSTGNVVASFSSNLNRTLAFSNGYYWGTYNFGSTNQIFRYTTSGGTGAFVLPLSTTWSFLSAGLDGSLLAADYTNGDLWRTTSSSPVAANWTKIYDGVPGTSFNSTNPATASFYYGSGGLLELVYLDNAGAIKFLDFNPGYASFSAAGSYSMGSYTSIGGFGRAHVGVFQSGMQGATPIVTGYDSAHSTYTSFGSSILKNPQNMAFVLAPEPSTYLGMGLGLGSLCFVMRRRKRV